MNAKKAFPAPALLLLLLPVTPPAHAADATVKLYALPGAATKIRIEGTSSVHDWQMESHIIGGFVEAGDNFPIQPGQELKPGKAEARVEARIPVRTLKSLEKDGRPYSDPMDQVVYEHLKEDTNKFIWYYLKELVLKETPKSKDLPYLFESKGALVVAGVTNTVSMPVSITPLGDNKVKIAGMVTVKMSDFNVEPPSPKGFGFLIKTGDEVKLFFEWVVGQRSPPAMPK
jgi:hypothetical protein